MPGLILYSAVKALAQKMQPGEEIRLGRTPNDPLGPSDSHTHHFAGEGISFALDETTSEVVITKTMDYSNG
jgi:hypothetical protein